MNEIHRAREGAHHWYAQYSLHNGVKRLEAEGHEIITSGSGVSLQVQKKKR